MKYCHICGTRIEDDSIITCPSCGRKQHSFRRPDGVVIDPYQMVARKPAPVEEIPPVVEPIIEEPVIEEPIVEETPIVEEKPAVEPEVAPTPAINPTIEEKPAKKSKGLIIGLVCAVVGVIAIGTAGALLIPGLLNGGNEDTSGGIFHSRPSDNNPVAKDPIGTWASYEGSSLHYAFEIDGSAKYWQTNYQTGDLDWMYYGTWTRSGSDVSADYTLYFNSGCAYMTMKKNFIVYGDHIESSDGGQMKKMSYSAPEVDAICNVYSDAHEYVQTSGKTGHWLELGLSNVCVFRQYDQGSRLDFYKGTWTKVNSTTLKITMNQKMANGTGNYTSITPSSDTLTIGKGYLTWGEDTMYPLTAKE